MQFEQFQNQRTTNTKIEFYQQMFNLVSIKYYYLIYLIGIEFCELQFIQCSLINYVLCQIKVFSLKTTRKLLWFI